MAVRFEAHPHTKVKWSRVMKTTALTLSGISIIALISVPAVAQQVTGVLGFARRHHHNHGKQLPPPAADVRRGDQGEGLGVEALVAAARRAAEGRAQRAAHHDR